MDKIEQIVKNSLNWKINSNSNAPAHLEPDAWDLQNRTHQIGSNHKTMGNSGYILTADIVADFTELLNREYADFLSLYCTHKKEGEWLCSYSKADAIEFFSQNPDLLYYDTASDGKTKVVRIKVLSNLIRKYMANSTFKERL